MRLTVLFEENIQVFSIGRRFFSRTTRDGVEARWGLSLQNEFEQAFGVKKLTIDC
jgi:hypothetical protein